MKKQLSLAPIIFMLGLMLGLLVMQPLAVLACATCGCSELCPLAMIEDTENSKNKVALSDSLWGSIILKMAYQRDAQLRKLAKHMKCVNTLTTGAISTAVGGTLGQNIVSLCCLNQDFGNDSYLPGSIGLGLSGLVNIAFDGSMLINWRLRKKIKARQLVIKNNVETILSHLEYSESACPQAQKDLAEIIGERASGDCLKMWRMSHSQIASTGQTTGMLDKTDKPVDQSLDMPTDKTIDKQVDTNLSQNIITQR